MKKIKTIITVVATFIFLSGIQSCYVEQDTGRHRMWYHRHYVERDRDRDHQNDRDRGGVIIDHPDRHDRDDHNH